MGGKRELNPSQRRFVEEYLVDLNASRAAKAAGYGPKWAGRYGSTLAHQPHVAEAIRKSMAARSKRTRITADRMLREYARIAFADIRSFTKAGQQGLTLKLKSLDDLTEDEAAAVAEVTSESDGTVAKLKLHDKKRALDAIARHLGLFGKRLEPERESPAAAAQRIRELIKARLARLAEPDEPG